MKKIIIPKISILQITANFSETCTCLYDIRQSHLTPFLDVAWQRLRNLSEETEKTKGSGSRQDISDSPRAIKCLQTDYATEKYFKIKKD